MLRIITFALSLTAFLPALFGQNEIKELLFPYYNDYFFTLSGESVSFDKYNFPSKTSKTSSRYVFRDHTENSKGRKMNCRTTNNTEGEKEDVIDSWLILDKKGMSWALFFDVNENKKRKDKTTQAISLPVTEGHSWTTFFGDKKTDLAVISTDTIIETYKGKVHAFGIRYKQLTQTQGNIQVWIQFEEYYAQYWGKIRTRMLIYMYFTDTEKTQRLVEENCNISDCNIPQEFLDKVNFVKD